MTMSEFEDEFHELWSDPEEEALASEELAEEEASIEQNNLDYEKGLSHFSEKIIVSFSTSRIIPTKIVERQKYGCFSRFL